MALYNRLLGTPANGERKIPMHQFKAILMEWRGGALTGTQAQDAVAFASGVALAAQEVTDVNTLLGTIPTGTTAANINARLERINRIESVLMMADAMQPGYDTDAALRAKLGVA